MPQENTTAVVQRYLSELTGEAPAEPVIRSLLDRAVLRLQRLCATLLHHDYPRLTRPPLNLETDDFSIPWLSDCSRPCARPVPGPSGNSSPSPASTSGGS